MEDDWVVDSLVGFLQSPVWRYPVANFTEQNCIVFEEKEGDEAVYEEIYSEYQTLIEKLLDSFMSDLGVTEEQLTHACAKSKNVRAEHEKQLQPLIASGDYETFKAMMTQKNVELELQALELLQKRLGQSPDIYQPQHSPTPKQKLAAKRNAQEERELQDALKLSLKESDSKKRAEDEEMERLLELAIQESLRLYKMQEPSPDQSQQQAPVQHQQQQQQQQKEENAKEEGPIAEKRQVQAVPEEAKLPRESSKHSLIPLSIGGSQSGGLGGGSGGGRGGGGGGGGQGGGGGAGAGMEKREMTGEQAAQLWLQSAKSELENRHSPLLKQRASKGLPSDLKARERYLKEQRNRLLERKKQQRDEALRQYKETHPWQSRLPPKPSIPATTSTRTPQEPKSPNSSTMSQPGTKTATVTTAATTKKPGSAGGGGGGGGGAKNRILCDVILKKLREEQDV